MMNKMPKMHEGSSVAEILKQKADEKDQEMIHDMDEAQKPEAELSELLDQIAEAPSVAERNKSIDAAIAKLEAMKGNRA